jgi:hypothetical protein
MTYFTMHNKTILIIAVVAVFTIMITSAVVSENAFAKCKKSRSGHGSSNRQTISHANVCGNGNDALDINCQNLANQVQGDGNAVNIIGVQN